MTLSRRTHFRLGKVACWVFIECNAVVLRPQLPTDDTDKCDTVKFIFQTRHVPRAMCSSLLCLCMSSRSRRARELFILKQRRHWNSCPSSLVAGGLLRTVLPHAACRMSVCCMFCSSACCNYALKAKKTPKLRNSEFVSSSYWLIENEKQAKMTVLTPSLLGTLPPKTRKGHSSSSSILIFIE